MRVLILFDEVSNKKWKGVQTSSFFFYFKCCELSEVLIWCALLHLIKTSIIFFSFITVFHDLFCFFLPFFVPRFLHFLRIHLCIKKIHLHLNNCCLLTWFVSQLLTIMGPYRVCLKLPLFDESGLQALLL